MPAPCTADDFLTLTRKSGVADEAALAAFERQLSTLQPPPDAAQLAGLMVRNGLLTSFQAKQILHGRWKKFFLGGKYKVLEPLGSGGMGKVFLCEHSRMGRRVAVKLLPPDKANVAGCRQRFQREARAVAALDHPNVVRAHDLEESDGWTYLVMEYVDGSNLQEIVTKNGPLSVERACHYIWQAALGLDHAHELGLVHRDIKPANLLLDRSGLVKILDLGLARFSHDVGDDLTRQLGGQNLIGTADYLAPEQAMDSHGADIRADIYSLGITFFFLLTRRTPFKEGTIAQKLLYHRVLQPQPVRAVRPDVPEEIERIISRMIAKDKRHRYQTPMEVVTALDRWTEAPIPPPPESEMPQLSRAARRAEPATTPIRSSRSTSHSFPAPRVGARPSDRSRRTPWAMTAGAWRSLVQWFSRRR